jgi:hypothetical protein
MEIQQICLPGEWIHKDNVIHRLVAWNLLLELQQRWKGDKYRDRSSLRWAGRHVTDRKRLTITVWTSLLHSAPPSAFERPGPTVRSGAIRPNESQCQPDLPSRESLKTKQASTQDFCGIGNDPSSPNDHSCLRSGWNRVALLRSA